MPVFDGWAEQERAVFIVGVERSGTTVMYRTLAEAPGFWPLQRLAETHAFENGRLSARPLGRATRNYLGDQYESFIATADEQKLEGRALARAFFHAASRQYVAGRMVEKTPRHLHMIPSMLDAFPKAQIVIMLRNPRDIVISHRARLKRDLAAGKPAENLGWLAAPVDDLLARMRIADAAISDALSRWPDKVVIVSYERMIAEPAVELERLGAHLGMPDADVREMIARALHERKSEPDKALYPAANSPIGPTARKDDLLSPEEEAAIAAVSFVNLRAG